MKKKFRWMAAVLVIATAFGALAACGESEAKSEEVTAEVWEAALSEAATNVTIQLEIKSEEMGNVYSTYQRDNDISYFKNADDSLEQYILKDGDLYWKYKKEGDVYVKSLASQWEGELLYIPLKELIYMAHHFEDFAYESYEFRDGAYYLKQEKIDEMVQGTGIENYKGYIKLEFAESKLSKFVYDTELDVQGMHMKTYISYTVTYGGVTLTLPEVSY